MSVPTEPSPNKRKRPHREDEYEIIGGKPPRKEKVTDLPQKPRHGGGRKKYVDSKVILHTKLNICTDPSAQRPPQNRYYPSHLASPTSTPKLVLPAQVFITLLSAVPPTREEEVRSTQNHAKIPFMKTGYRTLITPAHVIEISITRLPHLVTSVWGMEMEVLILTGDTGTTLSSVEVVIGVRGISRLDNWKGLGCQFQEARVCTP